jgi:predicted permease
MKRFEQRLDAELRDHFEREVAARMQAGASEAEARRATRLAFGGLEQVKEAVRDVRPGLWLEQLGQDLRHGARALRRSPGFTATVALTLALAIAANAAIFQLVNAVLLRPLPVPEPQRLVLLASSDGSNGRGPHPPGPLMLFSHPLYRRVLADGLSAGGPFAGLAAEQSGGTRSALQRPGERGAPAELAAGRSVSASYFSVLGVRPLRGRTFAAGDETAPGANPVLVLSHHLWQRRFGGDPSLLGAQVTVNGRSYTVVGITPPGFVGTNVGAPTDFWVPLTMEAQLALSEPRLGRAMDWWLLVVGRLAPGVSLREAEARVNVALQQHLAANPVLAPREGGPRAIRAVLEPAGQGVASARRAARDPLLALMAGVGLLLVIGYVNVSHLVVARAGQRRRELSVRRALGATAGRLARQLLVEGALLAALGVGLAALLAPLVREGLLALAPGRPVLNVSADGRLAAFAGALGLATTLLLGLVPTWHARRANVTDQLRATAPALAGGAGRGLPGRLLLVSQVALSALLLVGAGLLAASLQRLRAADKGFDEDGVVLFETSVRAAVPELRLARATAGQVRARALELYAELLRRVAAVPGVTGAGMSVHGVLGSGWVHDVWLPGAPPARRLRSVNTDGVSPGYFEATGMRLLRGRAFTAADHQQAPRVAVVNETLARRLFAGGEALGRRFRDVDPGEIVVVGVVADARLAGVRRDPPPIYFVPLAQQDHFGATVVVRAAGDPAALGPALREAVRAAHPALTMNQLRTVRSQVDRTLGAEQLLAALSAGFGAAALLLVCLGLYGSMSRWALGRTPELGLRMALGQTPAGVRWLVLRQAFALVLAGLALGLPAAAAGGRLLRGLLYGLDPLEPTALAVTGGLLLLVAGAAAFLPARRASRIDPAHALRCE